LKIVSSETAIRITGRENANPYEAASVGYKCVYSRLHVVARFIGLYSIRLM
jgi:hypothetical protein